MIVFFTFFLWSPISCHKNNSTDQPPTAENDPNSGQKYPGTTPEIFAPGIVSISNATDYACSFSPDGHELYFTRSTQSTQQIMVCKLVDGYWSTPVPVTFISGYAAHEPHVTFDNRTLYFGWFHPLPAGETGYVGTYGIYASQRTTEDWSTPTYVGQGMFVSSSQDGQLYVTDLSTPGATYLANVTVTTGRFTDFERLHGGMDALRSTYSNQAHPCIAPDGSYILFDVEGGIHLYVCFKKQNGAWGDAIDLSAHGFNRNAGIPSISPDGKYLFFGLNGDLWWVDGKAVTNLKPIE
jgi:Tol biopolymer transport system component